MRLITMTAVICGALGIPVVVLGQHGAPPPSSTIVSDQAITGDWVIHFQAGHQSVSGNLRLQSDGEQITGSIETGHTGPGTVQDGKWSKPKLSATLVFEKHESVALKGELKSDGTLGGHYTTEGRTETWMAERGKTAAAASGVYAQYEGLIGMWDMTPRYYRGLLGRRNSDRRNTSRARWHDETFSADVQTGWPGQTNYFSDARNERGELGRDVSRGRAANNDKEEVRRARVLEKLHRTECRAEQRLRQSRWIGRSAGDGTLTI